MFLCYVDESGYTGDNLADPHQPKLVLCGVLVEDKAWRDIERDVSKVRTSAAKHLMASVPTLVKKDKKALRVWSRLVSGRQDADAQDVEERLEQYLAERFELHATHIIGGREEFFGIDPARRKRWLRDCIAIFEDRQLELLVSVVDKKGLQGRVRRDPLGKSEHPDQRALDGLLASLESFVAKRKTLGLIVSDQVENANDHRSRLLRWQREEGSLFSAHHVIDTIHFVDSRASSLIQLADIATYLVAKIHRGDARFLAKECDRVEALIHDTRRFP